MALNERWSLDFVSDQLTDGRRLRILRVVDDCSRECLTLTADTSLSGGCVVRELDRIIAERGRPKMIVSDNGTKFTSNAVLGRFQPGWVALHRAGQAEPNAFVENFNGRLRGESLNETLFSSLAHARIVLQTWRNDYNTQRPHSRIGWLTPAEHALNFTPRRSDPALRSSHSYAPVTDAPKSIQNEKTNRPSELKIG